MTRLLPLWRGSYVLNIKFARGPRVWLLTGLYLLEGACIVVLRAGLAKVSAGISSARSLACLSVDL